MPTEMIRKLPGAIARTNAATISAASAGSRKCRIMARITQTGSFRSIIVASSALGRIASGWRASPGPRYPQDFFAHQFGGQKALRLVGNVVFGKVSRPFGQTVEDHLAQFVEPDPLGGRDGDEIGKSVQ